MRRRTRPSPDQTRLARLVWVVSVVGVASGAMLILVGSRAIQKIDAQYDHIHTSTINADMLMGSADIACTEGFEAIQHYLGDEQCRTPLETDGPLQLSLERCRQSMPLDVFTDSGLQESIESVGGTIEQLRLLLNDVGAVQVERLQAGASLQQGWAEFQREALAFEAAAAKAQGRARLQLLARLRDRSSPEHQDGADDRRTLLELIETVDAYRTVLQELTDLELLAERLRVAPDPTHALSIRDNQLVQTIDRLRWGLEQLNTGGHNPAGLRTEKLVACLLGGQGGTAEPAVAGLYALKTRQLRAEQAADAIAVSTADLSEQYTLAKAQFAVGVRTAIEEDVRRAAANYREAWRDALLVALALMLAFLVLSARIAKLGTRTESSLRQKNTELQRLTCRLEDIATTDELTGLPNRRLFLDRLDQLIKLDRREPRQFAVLFFDFDRFKVVNDGLGHEVGDTLLKSIADIFREEVRDADTVARFGGDEFVLLLSRLADAEDARACADRLLRRFAEPHRLGDHLVVSTASIGLVHSDKRYQAASEMVRDADAAMYQAKQNGKAQVAEYDEAMHARAMIELTIENDLRRAVAENQIRVFYQPIVDLTTGELTGFEALARWQHPELGLIGPAQFIPIAEDSGAIIEIGAWMLRTAAAQIARWNRDRDDDRLIHMNVNVSKRQLIEDDFCGQAIACIREHALPPGVLRLEVTESLIAHDPSVIVPRLECLKGAGIPIVLDDFGTGVSSLSTLHECPVDILKIDRAFIRFLDGNRSLMAVVASITALADSLGMVTIAEGVEDEGVIGSLLTVGCVGGQGYFFGKPLTPEQAAELITKPGKVRAAA